MSGYLLKVSSEYDGISALIPSPDITFNFTLECHRCSSKFDEEVQIDEYVLHLFRYEQMYWILTKYYSMLIILYLENHLLKLTKRLLTLCANAKAAPPSSPSVLQQPTHYILNISV